MKRRTFVFTSYILEISILVAALILAGIAGFRLDLSPERRYTLSEATEEAVTRLQDELVIRFYISGELKRRMPQMSELENLLAEYGRLDQVRIEKIDADDIDVDPDLGLHSREIQVVQDNQQTYIEVYSGLVMSYRDQFSVIPEIYDAGELEYELTSRIKQMTRASLKAVDVFLGDLDSASYSTVLNYLGQYYRVRLRNGDLVPVDSSLMVVIGADHNEAELHSIDEAFSRGVPLLVAAESRGVLLDGTLTIEDKHSAPLFSMLEAYGITVNDGWVYDTSSLQIPVQQQEGAVAYNRYLDYPQWLRITSDYANTAHPVSRKFAGLDLFWASSVDGRRETDVTYTTLYSSSSQSVEFPEPDSNPEGAVELFNDIPEEVRRSYALGILATGRFSPYFSIEDADSATGISAFSNRLMVIGDSDFPSDLYQSTGSVYNILSFHNMVEYLAGDEDMLNLRTRGTRNTRLDALEEGGRTGVIRLARLVGVFVIPLVLLAIGFVRSALRRRRVSAPGGEQ